MGKPRYTKPTDQLALEARQKSDFVDPGLIKVGEYPGPSDNGFVGVDPIYQNFANETEKPHAAEDGIQKKVEQGDLSGTPVYTDDVDFEAGAAAKGETTDYEGDDDETKSGSPSGSPTPSTPPTGQSPATPPSNPQGQS